MVQKIYSFKEAFDLIDKFPNNYAIIKKDKKLYLYFSKDGQLEGNKYIYEATGEVNA